MQAHSPQEVTRLLLAWSEGDAAALDALAPLVEAELHRIAHRFMGRERSGHVLQTSALVNEAYLRLIDLKAVQWQDRAHFFALAARLMRHILVDFARERESQKRGGEVVQVPLAAVGDVPAAGDADLVAVDEALTRLAELDRRKAEVVEMRFFGGLSVEEVAAVLGLSGRTVTREWRLARAWLLRELGGEAAGGGE
jgi:RNA polymerase sigma factor (TIGR02999 family)